MKRLYLALAVIAVLPLAPWIARAQGTLSTQGFGYPPGQLSARAQGTGGALGEFDPHSPLNPASILAFGRPSVYFQYSPEIRRVTSGETAERALVTRFPVVGASVIVRDRLMIGLSISTLADRSWQTTSDSVVGVGLDTTTATAAFRATGALNDIRFAAAYMVRPALRLGVAFHALSGESRSRRDLVFADTARFVPVREEQQFSFSGKGASIGVDWRPAPALGVAASARFGGTVTSWRGDTAVTRGKYPARAGGAVLFSGIAGATLAARADWEGWSRVSDLSVTGVPTFDVWNLSVGAEVKGPRLFGSDIPLRAGIRRRTLPFGLPDGSKVDETGIAGGLGIPLARGRAGADIGVERDLRSAGGSVRERAWTVSVGFNVRL
ncbi:MAG: hypothetical protein M3373_04405 [Gemmatimonadota bacterium]|nr:hypothetical protein [Gemmatimonadota bacterium]